jgi:hypothetical protein
MPNKKKKNSNIVLDFARGFLGKKENVSPAAKFYKAQQKKKDMLKKLGYWLDFSRTFIAFAYQDKLPVVNDDAGILLMERGVRFLEFLMSQTAQKKEIVLTYRGVAYVVKRNVASN